MEVATIPFIQQLRNRTAAQHASLESLPVSRALLSDTVTHKDYALYLLCMKDVIAFYDAVILPQLDTIIPDGSSRKKLPALTRDLEYLKEKDLTSYTVAQLKVPVISDKAFALGIAYVIEGSTLGGRVIIKHLSPRLGVTETQGAVFFGGYGADTGSMWKQFLDTLIQFSMQEEHASQVIRGALAGFEMIADHFSKNSALNEN